MLFDRQYVLCYGSDDLLLETRRQLLQRAGYAVLATSDELTVATRLRNGDVRILIFCDSLESAEIEKISNIHGETQSSASILRLDTGNDACNGSAAFLAAVVNLRKSSVVPAPR